MPIRNYSLHVLLSVTAWPQQFYPPSRLFNKVLLFLFAPGSDQRIYSIRSRITNASLVALPRYPVLKRNAPSQTTPACLHSYSFAASPNSFPNCHITAFFLCCRRDTHSLRRSYRWPALQPRLGARVARGEGGYCGGMDSRTVLDAGEFFGVRLYLSIQIITLAGRGIFFYEQPALEEVINTIANRFSALE